MLLNPFRTAVPFWGQTTQILSSLPPKRDCGSKRVNPMSSETPSTLGTAVLFFGDKPVKFQVRCPPKRGCGPKRVNIVSHDVPHIYLKYRCNGLCVFSSGLHFRNSSLISMLGWGVGLGVSFFLGRTPAVVPCVRRH